MSNVDRLFNDVDYLKRAIQDFVRIFVRKAEKKCLFVFVFQESYKKDVGVFKSKLFQMEKKSSRLDEILAKFEKFKRCAAYNKLCF